MIKNKVLAFDLDDVICKRPPNLDYLGKIKYKFCVPIKKNIKIINNFYDKGAIIRIYTARGMSYYRSDIKKIKKNLYKFTLEQLLSWAVKYHSLIMGKIHYDLLIDDKALNVHKLTNKKILDYFNN